MLEPGEPFTAAVARVHDLLDSTVEGWADNLRWRRVYELTDETGAVDLPGTSWRDRPAVLRTPSVALASDHSAAPGLLTEVAHNASRSALAALSGG